MNRPKSRRPARSRQYDAGLTIRDKRMDPWIEPDPRAEAHSEHATPMQGWMTAGGLDRSPQIFDAHPPPELRVDSCPTVRLGSGS